MVSNLDITVAHRAGYSYLKDAYTTQPFRIVPVGQNRSDRAAYLMIMSSSPGILSGDEHRINIRVEADAMLQLKSQSYQRLFDMEGSASQYISVKMRENSNFAYVPHPVVPHQNSSFFSTNKIEMADHCSLILSEIITCGRKHSGELFQYSHFQNLTEVYHRQKLILKDNVLLQPAIMPLNSLGILEGYTHQGTFMFVNTKGIVPDELIAHFYPQLQQLTNVEAGISPIQQTGFVIRILGNGAEPLFDFFQQVQNHIWDHVLLSNQKK